MIQVVGSQKLQEIILQQKECTLTQTIFLIMKKDFQEVLWSGKELNSIGPL